jgi:ATPase involved in DNA repair
MGKYGINRICLKNFKLFGGEPYTVSFGKDPLVIFDGPNGYGKTSVFDAIELALTGNIKRLYPVENKQVPSDLVVAHKDCPDVEISLEFYGDEPISITRRLKKPLPTRGTRIDRFSDSWDLFVVKNEIETQISEEEFNAIINNSNIARDYHLFHYVQQEETAHFLKSNKEHQRAEELAELFGGTKDAEAVKDKIDIVSKKISNICSRYSSEIAEIEKKYEVSKSEIRKESTEASHKALLPWRQSKSNSPEWDAECIKELTADKLNRYIGELNQLKILINFRQGYITERTFRKIASATKLLKSFVTYFPYLDKLNDFQEKTNFVKMLDSTLNKLSLEKVLLCEVYIEFDIVFDKVGFSDKASFYTKLDQIKSVQKMTAGNNKLYGEIVRYRDEIGKRLRQLDRTDNCPLCGASYEGSDALYAAIEECGEGLKSFFDEGGRRLLDLQKSFENEFLKPLTEKLLAFRAHLAAPGADFMTGLNDAVKNSLQLHNFFNWLREQNIEFSDLFLDLSSWPEFDPEERSVQLAERVRTKAPKLEIDYSDTGILDAFDTFFADYFENKPEHLNAITVDDVELKITYLRKCYFDSLSDIIGKYKLLKANLENLEAKLEHVKRIKGKVQREIRKYQKKLITDIEIPFFIYSGKILQTHQAGFGNGIFVKDPTGGDELKNVRLVSDWNSDHDILNTMSSGQIAAVVISLTLALNRVYAKHFNTILIDDPVQTMDDINMISLVELLRNEFADRQIIISTHEDEVSRYFLYKYIKHGHTARKINLMERKQYVLDKKVVIAAE